MSDDCKHPSIMQIKDYAWNCKECGQMFSFDWLTQDIRSDLAAVTAENKRLNVRVGEVAAKNAALHADLARVTRERDALLAALRFYADEGDYENDTYYATGKPIPESSVMAGDRGETARNAIRAVEAPHD